MTYDKRHSLKCWTRVLAGHNCNTRQFLKFMHTVYEGKVYRLLAIILIWFDMKMFMLM